MAITTVSIVTHAVPQLADVSLLVTLPASSDVRRFFHGLKAANRLIEGKYSLSQKLLYFSHLYMGLGYDVDYSTHILEDCGSYFIVILPKEIKVFDTNGKDSNIEAWKEVVS